MISRAINSLLLRGYQASLENRVSVPCGRNIASGSSLAKVMRLVTGSSEQLETNCCGDINPDSEMALCSSCHTKIVNQTSVDVEAQVNKPADARLVQML